jgi:hypothetical protein
VAPERQGSVLSRPVRQEPWALLAVAVTFSKPRLIFIADGSSRSSLKSLWSLVPSA